MNEIVKRTFEQIKIECRPNKDVEISPIDVFDIFFGQSSKLNIDSNFVGGINDERNTLHENLFQAMFPNLKSQVHFGTGKGGLETYTSTRFTVDFLDEANGIVYEIDGKSHEGELQKTKDRIKEIFFEIEHGYKTIRYTNEEVENMVIKRLEYLYKAGVLIVWNRQNGTRLWLLISR